MSSLPCGIYQHYKGGKYLVLGVAKHSESKEDVVVYVTLYDNDLASMWVRPLKMFNETVMHNGEQVARFRRISG